MILIGLMMLVLRSFAFKNRPPVLIEYCQVRKTLNVIRIILQYLASGIERFDLLDQLRLELAFSLHSNRSKRNGI